MVKREFWREKALAAWKKRSILWMAGVRRAGKTTLGHSFGEEVLFLDCELPSVRRDLSDPEAFLKAHSGDCLVLDEVHRLENPSELLKIAADHFPKLRILATGSSTLGASAKFKDTLTGRKHELWLTPMNSLDLRVFSQDQGQGSLEHRLLRGGLPPFYLSEEVPEIEFQEWMDAYWAKDIQELFRLERRYSFLKFTEMLFAQSGGIFEATRFAKVCEASRTTIANYLSVLEATYVAHVVRPFSGHRPTEIVAAPKVYGFDTGFICFYKGWKDLRRDDLGYLWEHYVLNEMHSRLQTRKIQYWRDKQHREVDFVVVPRGGKPIAIECKWSEAGFDVRNLAAFRSLHPGGRNYAVCRDIRKRSRRKIGDLEVEFTDLEGLIEGLSTPPRRDD